MPSTSTGRPPAAVTVAERYQRIERPLSGAVALLVGGAVAVLLLYLPLASGLLVAAVVVLAVRAPLFEPAGTARLSTDAPPDEVRADFASATPPLLAFQWGVADDVRPTADGANYDLSYLFGLRSVTMEVETRWDVDGADLRLVVTAAGSPWGTYDVSIEADGETGGTVVDVAWTSDRRFGLNRVPQWFVAQRYRPDALAAQGYAVVDRDADISVGV